MSPRAVGGLHHVTAVTADAPGIMRFYAGLLGLHVVKRTVDFDSPDVWHVYFGDEHASPGSLITFFEFPNAGRGRSGTTLPARLQLAVKSEQALGDLAARVSEAGVDLEPSGAHAVRFADPDGLALEVVVDAGSAAEATAVGLEHQPPRLRGVALHGDRATDHAVVEMLGVTNVEYIAPPPPPVEGELGAGTIHHVAWLVEDDDLDAWRSALVDAGTEPTPIRERWWFRSVYFRLPGGVLFELATRGPGFDGDGESLELPEWFEPLRPRLERSLTPLPPSDRIRPWRA